MSAQWEEQFWKVEELPETKALAPLDNVRRHLCAVQRSPCLRRGSVPGRGSTPGVTARSEDLLDDGFGRPA